MPYSTEPSNCKKEWKDISTDNSRGKYFCKIHGIVFKYDDNCNLYKDPIISNGKIVEKKRQGEKYYNNHRNGSKITEKVVNLKHLVVENHENGCTQVDIAKMFGVSQQYVSKIINSFKRNSPEQRFHNFSLTYDCDFDYALIPFREVRMKNTSYKLFRDENFHIQIFRKDKIVVRSLIDIFHNDIVKTKMDAIHYITKFLDSWNKYNIIFKSYRISSVHNAMTDNDIAKDILGKGQEIKYYDSSDGKLRTEVDLSHGIPELEHEHTKHAIPDSGKWQRIIGDVATNNYLDLSTTKVKIESNEKDIRDTIDVMVDIKNNLAEQNKAILLEIENKKLHMEVLHEMKDAMNDIRDENRKNSRVKESSTISRYDVERKDKVKKFIEEYK